ncbi:hypothetical protein [Photobacterium sp. OFAV2-7]|uniref:hypothetical protein n=1 Tax=Photobacterium sp. OFAV2-7 TaxID=2917748 RepID=UPI001EF56F83|nr:hypothetical protein [Photobacterium sp. OFAV2-7]MCG7587350.1 hypothetical protein [Photobacterium sp. OFAV2-7]
MAAPTGNTFNNKYNPEYAKQCYKLCLLGAIDKDLAGFFEVDRDTIKNWAKKHPEFAEARRAGKMQADAEVASKLFERATGCTVRKQKVLSNGDIVEYKEELPPETRAMEYWLQCRNRDKWNPKQKVELSGDAENPLAFLMAEVAKEAEGTSPLPNGS